MIPKEDQEKLPADENTPEKRADKLWRYFNKKDNGKIPEQWNTLYSTAIYSRLLHYKSFDINGYSYFCYYEVTNNIFLFSLRAVG